MSWIDFKALREKLDFAQVLAHYRVEFKRNGDRANIFCPLPGHNGRRRSPSFSADLKRGLFQCFGCGAKGNVLEFACLMENVDPQDSHAFHRVASDLQREFLSPQGGNNHRANGQIPPRAVSRQTPQPRTNAPPQRKLPVVINAALDFELRTLDVEHPYLRDRGFTPETVKHFGLGFCNRGNLKNRIAIPLNDMNGKLIGYAGRVVDDRLISEENPKYLLPGDREREGKLLQFRKSLFLYNGERIKKAVRDLIVVEGFPGTWWLWQNGVSAVVALMGSSCSKEQAEWIIAKTERESTVWVMTDGDDAGRRCAGSVFVQIGAERMLRYVKLEDGEQPTNWVPEDILESFGFMDEEIASAK